MTSRRSKIDVVMDILVSIQNKGGAIKPTHLMYKSNLSHKLLKEYVLELKSRSLIEEITIKENRYVTLTEKGQEFLARLKRMKEFIEAFGL